MIFKLLPARWGGRRWGTQRPWSCSYLHTNIETWQCFHNWSGLLGVYQPYLYPNGFNTRYKLMGQFKNPITMWSQKRRGLLIGRRCQVDFLEEVTLHLGSGKMGWIWASLEKWAEFEQVKLADIGAGVEKEFPAKSVSEPRPRAKNVRACAE